MSCIEVSKLKIPRKICSCAACGTKELLLVRVENMGCGVEYSIDHKRNCRKPYWYQERRRINLAVKAWNNMNEELLDGFDLVWFEVDRVYETRWDCMAEPERVRLAA
ncbi:hypothetical protein KAR91_71115 [Candidatus Pacearchaeota archaeon]|nr:hypothetical protein [Candidatus Pacearchaeota archaeon]